VTDVWLLPHFFDKIWRRLSAASMSVGWRVYGTLYLYLWYYWKELLPHVTHAILVPAGQFVGTSRGYRYVLLRSSVGCYGDTLFQPSPIRNVTGITLKVALDQSGGVACRSEVRPERFTSQESLDMVHRLRAQSDAVLIGVGTAIADNPSLLVRRGLTVRVQPLRVVIDPTLRLISSPKFEEYQLLSDGYPTVIYHRQKSIEDHSVLSSAVQLVHMPSSNVDSTQISVAEVVQHLHRRFEVQHLMVEGGPKTAEAFLRAQSIDRCLLVRAPIRFRDPIPSGISRVVLEAASLQFLGSIPSGRDVIECYSQMSVPWPSPDLSSWP
jgi:riboflavin-specific deaminase-like protein